MIRDDLKAAQIAAMKAGDKARTATIRLIQSAIKNRDIELRGSDKAPEDDALVTEVAEVAVIEDFLPRQMSEEEANAAIDAIIAETGASSVKDMGRVMAVLKERHASEIDMSKASGMVKARLQG